MNRDDLVRDTYAHFGLAMYKAQVLEHGIVNAMVVAKMPESGRITRRKIDAFMDRQFENTLGQLFRELKKRVAIPDDVSEVLGEALAKRNWLAHEYFRERATDFMTDTGCSRMIRELEMVHGLFDEACQKLDAIVRSIRERFGVTDEAIAAEFNNIVREAQALDG